MKRTKKKLKKRAPREAPPPTKWGKSRGGVYFEIRGGRKRNAKGEKLYRLFYYAQKGYCEVRGNQLWTLAELKADGITWLAGKPSRARLGR